MMSRYTGGMSDVTRILEAIERGEPQAAEELLPLVYDDLRRLATQMMVHEKPGQTLQPTALVHEAYLRLVAQPERASYSRTADAAGSRSDGSHGDASPTADAGSVGHAAASDGLGFANRRHFFAAAAEVMRRILVENARRKMRLRHGGAYQRQPLDSAMCPDSRSLEAVLLVDDALAELETRDRLAAQLVKLRYFGGYSLEEAAELTQVSRATAYRHWSYAKAWLHEKLKES